MDNKIKMEYYPNLKKNEVKNIEAKLDIECIILSEDTPSQKKEVTCSTSYSESNM